MSRLAVDIDNFLFFFSFFIINVYNREKDGNGIENDDDVVGDDEYLMLFFGKYYE